MRKQVIGGIRLRCRRLRYQQRYELRLLPVVQLHRWLHNHKRTRYDDVGIVHSLGHSIWTAYRSDPQQSVWPDERPLACERRISDSIQRWADGVHNPIGARRLALPAGRAMVALRLLAVATPILALTMISAGPFMQSAQGAVGASGVISGRVYAAGGDTGEEVPQDPVVFVVEANGETVIRAEDYAPEDESDPFANLPAGRTGSGMVRPDKAGRYEVSGLAAGDYLVAALMPGATYAVEPSEEVDIVHEGNTTRVRGYLIRLGDDSSAAADFVFAAVTQPATGEATLTIELTTYAANDGLEASRDRITDLFVEPSVAADRLAFNADGTVTLSGLTPGTYTLTITTERGFKTQETVTLAAGEDRRLGVALTAPEPGGLPSTGASGEPERTPAVLLFVGGVGIVALAGVLGLVVRRRHTGAP